MTNSKSTYAIFTNKKKETLVFYPCPKNANTSAKMFFAKHCNLNKKFIFISDKKPSYLQKESDFKGKLNLVNFLPNKQPFNSLNADYKCCLVRNPIERFNSAYRNRILYHRDIDFKNHTIDMVLDKLENKIFDNSHFLPQSFFLGKNINYYTFYSLVNNVAKFVNNVNCFFGKEIKFPKLQTGGNKIKTTLSKKQITKLENIYKDDYELLSGLL